MRSRTGNPSRTCAYSEPQREIARRTSPQFGRAAARDVARAEHEVGVRPPAAIRRGTSLGSCEKSQSISSTSSAPSSSARRKPARYARPSPSLRGAVQHARPRRSSDGEPVGDLAGAVGRAVVDHEHAVVGAEHLAERAHHRLEVLALVVGRQADGGPGHGPYHRRRWRQTLPKNADVADQFDLLADLLELEGSDPFRPLAYRRAAQRIRETAGSIAELALDGQGEEPAGDRQDDRGEDRPDRRDGRDRGDHQAQGHDPDRGRPVHAPARAGPEDGARGSGRSSASRPSSSCRPRPSSSACARSRGSARRPRSACSPRSRPRPRAEPKRALLGQGLPAVLAVVEALREHPGVDLVSEAGSVRRRRETFRDLDIIATADDPAALTEHFTKLDWVADVAAHGADQGDRALERRPALRPARRPARVLRQPAPALHGLEGAQRRAARERGARRALGLGVRRRERRDARGLPDPQRGGALRASRLPVHPARAARELGRARRGAEGRAAAARRARRPPRRPAHATRRGRTTARTRSRRWSRPPAPAATSTSRSPTTRTTCATASSSATSRRSSRWTSGWRRFGCCAGSRSTSRPTARSTSTTRRSRCSTG